MFVTILDDSIQQSIYKDLVQVLYITFLQPDTLSLCHGIATLGSTANYSTGLKF